MLGIVGTATVRATMLGTNFLPRTLDHTNTLERIYDDVLVDPDVTRVAKDLTDGLPIETSTVHAAVGVNIRLVLPPDTVRQVIVTLSDDAVRWLRGDVDTLRLRIDLHPIVANIAGAAAAYLSEVLAAVPAAPAGDVIDFRTELRGFVGDLRAGRTPGALPGITLNALDADAAQEALIAAVPESVRASVGPVISAALSAHDLDDALAAVGVTALVQRAQRAAADLTNLSGSVTWDLAPYLRSVVEQDAAGSTVHTVRWWLDGPRQAVFWISVVLLLAALAALAGAFGGSTLQRARRALVALGCGTAVSAIAGVAGWLWLGGLVDGIDETVWPSSVRGLVGDNAAAVRRLLLQAWLGITVLVLLAGLAVVAAVVAIRWIVVRPADIRVPLVRWRAVAVTIVAAAAIAGITIVVASLPPSAERRCNGYAYLCNRRFDQVVSLATHNAMANAQDRFMFPLQDPDIDTQLDAGARALQLDSYEWETSDQFVARVHDSDLPPAWAKVFGEVARIANPHRPGTWLCHVVCRAGALPLVPALRDLREWLNRSPDEVVTIILQDETSAALTRAAFRNAGLLRYLARPPADPSAQWPTLGEMIASGHRLVAFTENARNAAPWLQNFYSYGEETPFAFDSTAALQADSSCVAHRGGTGHRLFLLNHFVTTSSGSRQASAEANSSKFLTRRIARCSALRGHSPTVVAVDFASLGHAQRVVDKLNRRMASTAAP
jgi:hypothetical protein